MSHKMWMACLVGMCGALLGAQQSITRPVISNLTLAFPPVTVQTGETAQVNVANVGSGSAACTGSVLFHNPAGPVSDPVAFNLAGGQIFSLGYPNSSAVPVHLLAYVLATGCTPAASLEVMGGNTHAIVTNPGVVPVTPAN
jgi:hypothetical protein